MSHSPTLGDLNVVDRNGFVQHLGSIFEHSPWVAEQAYDHRPFASVANLHKLMVELVDKSSVEARLTLIRSHPELAGKEASEDRLTEDSKSEQSSAGLDQCSPEEYARLNRLNKAYREKFDFPFIIAVRGRNRWQIMEDMEQRLGNSPDEEFARCIKEIARIAQLRLEAMLGDD